MTLSLAYLEDNGEVLAVAGFRLIENLIGTRVLYVDDLVTSEARRSKGHGAALLEWLVARAHADGCTHLELDCGVQRFGTPHGAPRLATLNHLLVLSAPLRKLSQYVSRRVTHSS
jgi:GNAT superfamily N-acetyltransferase